MHEIQPLLTEVQAKAQWIQILLGGIQESMDNCTEVFENEAMLTMFDSGLSIAFDLLTMVYTAGLGGFGAKADKFITVADTSTSIARGDVVGAVLDVTGLADIKKAQKTFETLDKLNDMKKFGKSADMCFVAGTLVVIEGQDGKQATKSIEQIEVGDKVWSRKDRTGEQGFKPVLQTFVTHPLALVHLTYTAQETGAASASARWTFANANDADAGTGTSTSTVTGTPNHPFWSVTRQAWIEMGELYIGERLLLADGSFATVTRTECEEAPCLDPAWQPGVSSTGTLGTPADAQTGTFITYNFEVADWHTYFAGDVWVHNTGGLCDDLIEAARRKPGMVNKMDLDPQVRRQLEDMNLLPRKQLRDERGRFIEDPNNPKSPYVYTDAQRRADWKRIANDPTSPLTPAQRQMVKDRGYRGPQQANKYGELETMELAHEPTPLRQGGTDVVPQWPGEHAARDPNRQLKKR